MCTSAVTPSHLTGSNFLCHLQAQQHAPCNVPIKKHLSQCSPGKFKLFLSSLFKIPFAWAKQNGYKEVCRSPRQGNVLRLIKCRELNQTGGSISPQCSKKFIWVTYNLRHARNTSIVTHKFCLHGMCLIFYPVNLIWVVRTCPNSSTAELGMI